LTDAELIDAMEDELKKLNREINAAREQALRDAVNAAEDYEIDWSKDMMENINALIDSINALRGMP
jgi:hypothetical protein